MVSELVLLTVVKSVINIILEDTKKNIENRENMFLTELFSSVDSPKISKFDILDEAISIFSRTVKDPRYPTVDLSYNPKHNRPLTLFLSLGQENYNQNSIGNDQSEISYDIHQQEYDLLNKRRFDQMHNIYIYSDSHTEVIVIYHVLKMAFISCLDWLGIKGFDNITISGQDIAIQGDSLPKNMHYRILSIKFNYEIKVPNLFKQKLLSFIHLNSNIDTLNGNSEF